MTFFLASSRDLGIARACRRVTGLYPEEYFKTQKVDFSANEILLMFLGCIVFSINFSVEKEPFVHLGLFARPTKTAMLRRYGCAHE